MTLYACEKAGSLPTWYDADSMAYALEMHLQAGLFEPDCIRVSRVHERYASAEDANALSGKDAPQIAPGFHDPEGVKAAVQRNKEILAARRIGPLNVALAEIERLRRGIHVISEIVVIEQTGDAAYDQAFEAGIELVCDELRNLLTDEKEEGMEALTGEAAEREDIRVMPCNMRPGFRGREDVVALSVEALIQGYVSPSTDDRQVSIRTLNDDLREALYCLADEIVRRAVEPGNR